MKTKTPTETLPPPETDLEIYQLESAATTVCNLARQGNKYALRKLARVAVQLTRCMDELAEKKSPAHKPALECWRPIFAGLPFAPVLKHRHGGDLKQIKARLELLRVGSALNFAKAGAKYHPDTLINAYVSNCLVHLWQVRSYIDSRLKYNYKLTAKQKKKLETETPEKALARCTKDEHGVGWIAKEEMPIHLAAYNLPPLAKSAAANEKKSLADKWARDVFMPLIRLNESSLEKFARRMGLKSYRRPSDIQHKVAQSLETLAATNLPAS